MRSFVHSTPTSSVEHSVVGAGDRSAKGPAPVVAIDRLVHRAQAHGHRFHAGCSVAGAIQRLPSGDEDETSDDDEDEDETSDEDEDETSDEELTSSQKELVDYMNDDKTRELEHVKPGKKWPQKKMIGQIGEYETQQALKKQGHEVIDANQALGYNVPGIDIINSGPKIFNQSKLHISKSTANKQTYKGHLVRKSEYSHKFVKSLAVGTAGGKKKRKALHELSFSPKKRAKLAVGLQPLSKKVEAHRKDYEDALNDDNALLLPEIDEDDDVVKYVSDNMGFHVPSDIHDDLMKDSDLSSEDKKSFHKLPHDTKWYRKVAKEIPHTVPRTSAQKKKDEDEDYDPSKD
jgi:hypothetical protein